MHTNHHQQVLANFRRTLARENGFLVGAAVGAGMTAQAAQAGGADFLMALSAGRMRIMGVPSLSCQLPVLDSNDLTQRFARNEILGRIHCPVFVGVSVLDPGQNLEQLIAEIRDRGFHGVTNWPSALYYPDDMACLLDECGIGFQQELNMLQSAVSKGLAAIAYVHSPAQAEMAARAGLTAICLNVGWTSGGATGVQSHLTLEEISLQARESLRRMRRIDEHALLMLEGGPLESASQLGVVRLGARISGYIGGSSLDRLPVEDSVTAQTLAFKNTVSDLARASRQASELQNWANNLGLVGSSQAFLLFAEKLQRHAMARDAVYFHGESGTPKQQAAHALHQIRNGDDTDFIAISARDLTAGQLERRLFDDSPTWEYRGLADPALGTILLEHIDLVPMRLQARLARYLRDGVFVRPGSRQLVKGQTSVLVSSEYSLSAVSNAGKIHRALSQWFQASEIRLPSLSERLEDIDALFLSFAENILPDTQLKLSPVALRRLSNQRWPGNDAQLRDVVEKLVADGQSDIISGAALDGVLRPARDRVQSSLASERDLILEALWRNNFHRTNTAASLGMTRKTLYNKMKRLGLADQDNPA